MSAVLGQLQAMVFPAPINGQTTWVSTSERLKLWGDVDPSLQPAAFLVTHRETDEYRGLGLKRRRLDLQVWCYSRTDDPSTMGQTDLDNMMQSFESVFLPDKPGINQNTLGGLVYWCRLEGRVFKDPGDIDNQAMMIVPLVVEIP